MNKLNVKASLVGLHPSQKQWLTAISLLLFCRFVQKGAISGKSSHVHNYPLEFSWQSHDLQCELCR